MRPPSMNSTRSAISRANCISWVTISMVWCCDRDAAEQVEHLADPLGVERRGRLVDEHQLGVERHRPADADALLLPAGERRRIGVAAVGEADLGEDGVGARVGLGRAACRFTTVSASVMFCRAVRLAKSA